MIEFKCLFCGEELSSPESRKGESEVCPVCGTSGVVEKQKKRYAHTREKARIEKAGGKAWRGMSREEAITALKQLVEEGKLTYDEAFHPWRLKEPSEKQLDYLRELGVPEVPNGTTRGEASDLIDERRKVAPIGNSQWGWIEHFHGIPSKRMTYLVAAEYLDYLFGLQWESSCPYCGSGYTHPDDDWKCLECGRHRPKGPRRPPPPHLQTTGAPSLWETIKAFFRDVSGSL